MTIFYNAFHSPIGAHASFTLGCRGRSGGFGVELGRPADQSVYIGVETKTPGKFKALPFYVESESAASRYDHAADKKKSQNAISSYAENKIQRDYQLGTDTWSVDDLVFKIYSPVAAAPEPDKATVAELKAAYCPCVLAELTVDNRAGKTPRTAFFGFQASGGIEADSARILDELSGSMKGAGQGNSVALVTDATDAVAGQGFSINDILVEKTPENLTFGLGDTVALLVPVAAGKKVTARFVIALYRGGVVTSGVGMSYLYSRYFKTLASVARFGMDNFTALKKRAEHANALVSRARLSDDQKFQMIHAIRSYYGSTQLLDWDGKPFWVVNEGEYRMMNTFDLTVDQLFYEMKMNPWTVRNELDWFTRRYSYTDKLHVPGGGNVHPGGISFTHDMGRSNRISRAGYSTYELYNLSGCFSHMTHEQLVNWVLCAAVYAKLAKDKRWLKKNLPVFQKCLVSMMRRDHPKDSQRNGVMGLDSSRTLNGAEITTYDSLDRSLGQARNNVYLAVKSWAAYVAMAEIFRANRLPSHAADAEKQAARAAATIVSHMNPAGFIPAILGEKCDSKIIPAIEGLVFPYVLKMQSVLSERGTYGDLIRVLKTHLKTVLCEGACLYPGGGWKLSSSADNSWLSKIYLCQFVARKILGFSAKETKESADRAHAAWLKKEENLYWAWSDQMRSGVAHGSKYYPRGVTSILWLQE